MLTDFPAEAVDALLALTGPGAASPQVLVEVRQLGGAFARRGEHPSAFGSREAAYSLLIVGISAVPGVEDHGEAILEALGPWMGGHRLPNFTFTPRTTSTPTTRRPSPGCAGRAGPTTRRACWRSAACWGEHRPSAGMVVTRAVRLAWPSSPRVRREMGASAPCADSARLTTLRA